MLDEPGIGPISAAKLLACDPARFKSEATFARCTGTAPIPASSGKAVRYNSTQAATAKANNAIHTIAIICAKHHPRPRLPRTPHRRRQDQARGAPIAQADISRELNHRLTVIPLTLISILDIEGPTS